MRYRVYCLMGDGETAEGSVWEAMSFCSKYKLDNLVAVFDVNRLGQSQETAFGHDMELYRKRVESYGFHTIVVDGHDVVALQNAFNEAKTVKGKPTAVVAHTYKGRGIPDGSPTSRNRRDADVTKQTVRRRHETDGTPTSRNRRDADVTKQTGSGDG
ncbi:PREDICTED: transketolase-like protein 2 [Priapulus caudatus]|uniref:Transketolase-like protein 2 n=1 Tax=Priapulus caudatus TaxID=37621 RepID=A0ABM1ELW9_PRICU|nr:PREDICTED: transketolase-like protein 2 [Priapulus caudatus]